MTVQELIYRLQAIQCTGNPEVYHWAPDKKGILREILSELTESDLQLREDNKVLIIGCKPIEWT